MSVNPNDTVETYRRNWDGITPYALATVVHTRGATAAKAGAKAVVTSTGELIGWIGGGCLRGAVLRAARNTMETGSSKLIRVRPKDEIAATHDPDGVELHPSGCPGRGQAEVFIEPVMPKPPFIIIGTSQIARALADLASGLDVEILAVESAEDSATWQAHPRLSQGFIVIATQGSGDMKAIKNALTANAAYIAFIGSHPKVESLSARLAADGIDQSLLARLHAPAGLDIGARTPSEIAISILAEIISLRRTDAAGSSRGE